MQPRRREGEGGPTCTRALSGRVRRRQSRFNEADLDELLGDMSKMEFLLRFTISHPDMTTTIVGTSNPEHLKSNLAAAAKGPLPIDLYNEAKQRLTETVPSRYERTARLDRSTNDVKDITGAPKR